MKSIKARLRAYLRSAAEEALGGHMQRLTEGGATAVNVARLLTVANQTRELSRLRDYGFRVFSQFGEDGVLQHLLHRVRLSNDRFVEIGVQDYAESNTRLLAEKDNWQGLIVDAGDAAISFLRDTGLGDLRNIEFRQAFVTAENVNDLLRDQPQDLALLSIDIDGMDYWVWKALEVVRPAIVVIEYQNLFGPIEAIVVPYDAGFDRSRAHPSNLYWGASLTALEELGRAKGYAFVGTSDGPNAFFVREDLRGDLGRVTSTEDFLPARYRDSRGGIAPIADLEVLDLQTQERRKLSSFPGLAP